jgi:crotonobetainyl-CoA:carnitine CoA-transferase CaiB-like acyl-CoA transferase
MEEFEEERSNDTKKAEEIRTVFRTTVLTKTTDEWIDLLVKVDTAVGKVYSIADGYPKNGKGGK